MKPGHSQLRLTPLFSGIVLLLAITLLMACTTVNIAPTPSNPAAPGLALPATPATTVETSATPDPTATPEPSATPDPTATPEPTAPVTLAQGTWSIKMVTSRGNSFYPNLAVNFSQNGGVLSGNQYTYSSGGTTLFTEVLNGTVDASGNVNLNFTVKEGTALRATFKFTGKAGFAPPENRNKISGDPLPDADAGFEPCTSACGYQVTLEGGGTETGFFTMSNQ